MSLLGGRAGTVLSGTPAIPLILSLSGDPGGITLVTHAGHTTRWFRSRALKFAWFFLEPGICTYLLCDLIKLPSLTETQCPHPQEEDGDASVPFPELV